MLRRVMITALVIISCAASARADDTEIYGTINNPSLEPNVMILFDTSGSMATEDVPGDPYDPTQAYSCGSCTYSKNAVYYRRSSGGSYYYDLFASNVNSLGSAHK